jgi:hypothetical protein
MLWLYNICLFLPTTDHRANNQSARLEHQASSTPVIDCLDSVRWIETYEGWYSFAYVFFKALILLNTITVLFRV